MDNNGRMNIERRKHKKRGKRTIFIILLLLLISASFYLYHYKMTNGRLPWEPDEISDEDFFLTSEVYESTYSSQIDVSGYVEAFDTQNVMIRATGVVTGVFVKEGDTVSKGQLLATVDCTEQEYNVADIERQILVATISGSKSDSEMQLLQLQLNIAKQKLENTRAYANFDGVVVSVSIEEGDYFEAGSSVMTIIDNSKLKATVEIDEIDLQMLETGMKATLSSDSVPGEYIEAYVSYIPMVGRYSSQGIGVKDVELVIDNPPEGLDPGFSFEGVIDVETNQTILLVTQNAVVNQFGVNYLTKLYDDGTMVDVEVNVKYAGEGVVRILSGDISAGDTVVYVQYNSSEDYGFEEEYSTEESDDYADDEDSASFMVIGI